MPIHHSYTVLLCNLKLVVKLAIFIVIIGLIAAAILSNIVGPLIGSIIDLVTDINIDANSFINHPIITMKNEIINKCIAHINESNWQMLLTSSIMIFVLVRFFITIPILPVMKVLYNKMTSGYDIGLINAFVATGFQNLLSSLILSVVISVIDIGLFIGFGSLIWLSFNAELFILIPVLILAFICTHSLRVCLLCQWLPEICQSQSKNIFKNLKPAMAPTFKKFRKNFLCVLSINVVMFSIVMTTALPTFFVIPLLSIPIYIVLYCALSLTLNFSYHQQKYYIDNGTTIYTPTKLF